MAQAQGGAHLCASKNTRRGADIPPSAEPRRTHVRGQSWVAATGRQLRMHRQVYEAYPAAPDLAETELPVHASSEQPCAGHSTAARPFRGPYLSKKQHAPRGELGSRGTANCLPCQIAACRELAAGPRRSKLATAQSASACSARYRASVSGEHRCPAQHRRLSVRVPQKEGSPVTWPGRRIYAPRFGSLVNGDLQLNAHLRDSRDTICRSRRRLLPH